MIVLKFSLYGVAVMVIYEMDEIGVSGIGEWLVEKVMLQMIRF